MQKRQTFSKEFKLEAVRLLEADQWGQTRLKADQWQINGVRLD